MSKRVHYKRHPDDEFFDEVRLETKHGPMVRFTVIPRYKTSELSGDEWRISGQAQMPNECALIPASEWIPFDSAYLNLEVAIQAFYPGLFTSHPTLHNVMIQSIDFYRKGRKLYESTYEGNPLPLIHVAGHLPWALIMAGESCLRPNGDDEYCFQPGCPEKAVGTYRLKKEWCSRCGNPHESMFEQRRRFCCRHLRRGDASLEDADDNYEVIEGVGPDEAMGWEEDESPAVLGGIIDMTEEG